MCDLVFPACPERFASSELAVPLDIIALSSRIPACEASAIAAVPDAAPAIIFAIDNSSSMGSNDPGEMRFAAVANLLDDVRSLAPSAQVGFVFFSRRLQLDRRDNPLFAPAFPGDTAQHDAYVPLLRLDTVFAGGATGLDTLKALLRHDDRGNLLHATRRPASRDNAELGRLNLRDGTDITLAVDAARAAFAAAAAPPEARYLVLLTDGEPASVDIGREARRWDFAQGAGLPTAFTVTFDTTAAQLPPDSLRAFTTRVRANGYSAGNARSDAWTVARHAGDLHAGLRGRLLPGPLVAARAERAALTVDGTARASEGREEGALLFPAAVPLSEAVTEVRLAVDYSYASAVDPIGGPTARKERRLDYAFAVRRSAAVTELPAGLSALCREQPALAVLAGGAEPEVLSPEPGTLEARLALPAGSACPLCAVEITTTPAAGRAARASAPADTERVALAGDGAFLSAAFARDIGGAARPGDGRLQHAPGDSLVALWRNPANPLDRVRRAYPFPSAVPTVGIHASAVQVSRTQGIAPGPTRWMLVGAPSLRVAARAGAPAEPVAGPLPDEVSRHYVGLEVRATRAFTADIRVFSNLGEFVNKLSFSVPAEEFPKLPAGPDGKTRSLLVLWDNRAEDGRPVGTGTYVLKTTVTLEKLPGRPEEDAVRTDYRRVGVLRSP